MSSITETALFRTELLFTKLDTFYPGAGEQDHGFILFDDKNQVKQETNSVATLAACPVR